MTPTPSNSANAAERETLFWRPPDINSLFAAEMKHIHEQIAVLNALPIVVLENVPLGTALLMSRPRMERQVYPDGESRLVIVDQPKLLGSIVNIGDER